MYACESLWSKQGAHVCVCWCVHIDLYDCSVLNDLNGLHFFLKSAKYHVHIHLVYFKITPPLIRFRYATLIYPTATLEISLLPFFVQL